MKSLQIFLGLLLAAGAALAQQYNISTVAGIGTVQGYWGDAGPATTAQLNFPFRVVVDPKGNYYIADYLTQVIREVTTDGNINTVVGTGSFGFQGDKGPGIQAIISDVHALAVDTSGNLYFADTHNGRVRKLSTDNNVNTIAGNGALGYSGDGGLATNAELILPTGLAVDSSGNVYIADYASSTVRKVDTKGNISTVAGTGAWGYTGDGGPANKATLAAPYSLALDPAGNLYISDLGNNNIRELTPDGNIRTVVSNVVANTLAVDAAGSIYFPDPITNTVQKILANGTRFAIAGNGRPDFSGDGGAGTSAQLNQPYGISLDSAGNVYVADSGNQVIRLLKPQTASITAVNSASGVGATIAPGEIVTIYGSGLGPATGVSAQPGSSGIYATQLAGTTVSINGTNAPLIYTSASQVSAIVPYATPIGGPVAVSVTYQDQTFTAPSITIASSAPGIFTANASGSGPASAINQDGSTNSTAAPAKLGSVVTLYLTGEGLTNPAGVDGKVAVAPQLPAPQLPVTVTLAGQPATVTYAGAAPGIVAGLMQLNVQIPANLIQTFAAGPIAVPILVNVGYISTQPNVTITVAP